jgi:hypothetical protein
MYEIERFRWTTVAGCPRDEETGLSVLALRLQQNKDLFTNDLPELKDFPGTVRITTTIEEASSEALEEWANTHYDPDKRDVMLSHFNDFQNGYANVFIHQDIVWETNDDPILTVLNAPENSIEKFLWANWWKC